MLVHPLVLLAGGEVALLWAKTVLQEVVVLVPGGARDRRAQERALCKERAAILQR
jgi:hypothetical protein